MIGVNISISGLYSEENVSNVGGFLYLVGFASYSTRVLEWIYHRETGRQRNRLSRFGLGFLQRQGFPYQAMHQGHHGRLYRRPPRNGTYSILSAVQTPAASLS